MPDEYRCKLCQRHKESDGTGLPEGWEVVEIINQLQPTMWIVCDDCLRKALYLELRGRDVQR